MGLSKQEVIALPEGTIVEQAKLKIEHQGDTLSLFYRKGKNDNIIKIETIMYSGKRYDESEHRIVRMLDFSRWEFISHGVECERD